MTIRATLVGAVACLAVLAAGCSESRGRSKKTLAASELWLMNNPRPYLMEPDRVAEIIRDCLSDIGLDVRIRKFDWSSYLSRLQAGEHQLALIGWSTDNGDPDNFFTPMLSGASIGGPNYSRMRDEDFERLLGTSKEQSDWQQRRATFAKMHDIVRRVCPSVPLVYTKIAWAYRSDLKGFVGHPIKLRLHTVGRAGDGSRTLVFGRGKDSLTLDPAAASDGESAKVIDSIYETLVDFDADPEQPARIVPGLATRWNESDDRLSWTFELREDVRFHDGTRFDAEAVKLSLERLIVEDHPLAPAKRPFAANYREVAGVDALGPHRIRVRLKRPSVVILRNLAIFSASMVSPRALAEHGRRIATQPVGTGPFRFRSWKPDETVAVDRNDEWWGRPLPPMERIVFLQVKDWAGRRERLISGEIDLTDGVVFQDIARLEQTVGVEVVVRGGMNVCYLAMNNERAPFDDPRVRRAVAMAIDRARIVKLGYYGHAKAATDILPATIPGHAKDVLPDFDRKEARRLLEEAMAQ